MAISNATVVPILIAARLIENYRSRRVYAERTDRQWERMLAGGGDRVRLNTPAEGIVGDYDANTAITYNAADVNHLADIVIDKQKYFANKIDDIAAFQANSDLLTASTIESAQLLADKVDNDVRTAMVTDATAGLSAFTLDHASASLSANSFGLASLGRFLTIAKMPVAGRWLIVGPYTAELIHKFSLQNAVLAADYNSQLRNGFLGAYGGINIYADGGQYNPALVDGTNTGTKKAVETWIYGNDTAVAFAEQIRRVQTLTLETSFADAVRGLLTYGVKTVHANRLYKSVVTLDNIPV